jgi:hypothetical protein
MDDASLILRHQVLLATFQGRMGDHGIYCLLHEMFGHDIAVRISRSEGVNYPDLYDNRIRPPPLEDIIAGGGVPPLPSLLPPQPAPAESSSMSVTASSERLSHNARDPSLGPIHPVNNVQKRPSPSAHDADPVAAAKRPKPTEPTLDKGKGKAIVSLQAGRFTQPNAQASSSRFTLDHMRAPHDPKVPRVPHGRGSGPPKRPRESYLSQAGTIDWDLVTHEDIDWTTRVGIDGILYDREHKPEEYRLVDTPYSELVDWYMF